MASTRKMTQLALFFAILLHLAAMAGCGDGLLKDTTHTVCIAKDTVLANGTVQRTCTDKVVGTVE